MTLIIPAEMPRQRRSFAPSRNFAVICLEYPTEAPEPTGHRHSRDSVGPAKHARETPA